MIKIDATIHHHEEPDRTDQILAKLDALLEKGELMSAELDRLKTEVTETKTVMQSAAVLLGTLADKIRELSTDPAALKQLADDLDAEQAALGAAIVANTPAEPPTP